MPGGQDGRDGQGFRLGHRALAAGAHGRASCLKDCRCRLLNLPAPHKPPLWLSL